SVSEGSDFFISFDLQEMRIKKDSTNNDTLVFRSIPKTPILYFTCYELNLMCPIRVKGEKTTSNHVLTFLISHIT
ncbi:MAG TPA: hypothetical protein VE912_08065, partial [Bacteroidales bacterium]|nr:hypothetical protein [Bacteroidales bacterium]